MRLGRASRFAASVAVGAAAVTLAMMPATSSAASASSVRRAAHTAAPHSTTVKYWLTFYGWVDNTPPSPDIAHGCIHKVAGGVGTYSNPVTYADPQHLN